tara:strand:- start:61 stop:588 length:528 start_codon:yes stop_codon:yes gene_type:complete
MQIRKSKLRQIIQEEVANAKFIEVREDIYTDDKEQYEDDETKDANVSPDNVTLDELIVQEISKAMEKDTRHRDQAKTAKNLKVPSYVKKNVKYTRNKMADEEENEALDEGDGFVDAAKDIEKKGTDGVFTAKAKKAGMSVQSYADDVLSPDSDATTLTKQQASFAKAAKTVAKGK